MAPEVMNVATDKQAEVAQKFADENLSAYNADEFRLEIPGDMIGRAMTDIQKMNGTFQQPEADDIWNQ